MCSQQTQAYGVALIGLSCACLDFNIRDAKRKGIRRHPSVKLQGKDEAKFSPFVGLAEGGSIAAGGEEWWRRRGDSHFASSRARDDKRIR